VDGLIAELVDDMQSRPFAIFGHSLGGLLAFQMTHELVRRGLPRPVRLFLSAARLPKPMAGEPLHALADAELLAVLERLNGAPPEALAHRGLMEIMLPIVRADLRLAETWSFHSGEALDIPVSLLGGLWDPLTPPAEMERWRQYFSGQVDHRSYPGHHFYLLEQEAQLLRYLGDAVSAALLPSSESS
jgi:medium-chain acyl-[acyl-carrier-protein] hydrolase